MNGRVDYPCGAPVNSPGEVEGGDEVELRRGKEFAELGDNVEMAD